jgi:hypothetical protein
MIYIHVHSYMCTLLQVQARRQDARAEVYILVLRASRILGFPCVLNLSLQFLFWRAKNGILSLFHFSEE